MSLSKKGPVMGPVGRGVRRKAGQASCPAQGQGGVSSVTSNHYMTGTVLVTPLCTEDATFLPSALARVFRCGVIGL